MYCDKWVADKNAISKLTRETVMDDAQLRTVWEQRQPRMRAVPLAEPLGMFIRHKLAKRVKQLSKISAIWDNVIPSTIGHHTALESFANGVLTVRVDSPSHRFHLQTLLRGGIEKEIRSRFSGTLRKIRTVPGQFYSVDMETGGKRYLF